MQSLTKLTITRIPWERRRRELPLGLDIHRGRISVVAALQSATGVEVVLAATVESADELGQALDNVKFRSRQAVTCVHPHRIRHGYLESAHQLPTRHHIGAAANYAEDLMPNLPENDAAVARLAIGEQSSTIVAALQSDISSLQQRICDLGLELVAIDSPSMAWLRVCPEGILDAESGFIAVPTPLGVAAQSAQIGASPAQSAANITQAFTTLRQSRYNGKIIRTVTPLEATFHQELTMRLGSSPTILPLTIENEDYPIWSLAYGLCLWSVA